MNMLMARLAGEVDNNVQVSGLTDFPELRWREAILYYLFGIWAGKEEVTDRPKIIFGTVTLRLDSEAREYFAYGRSHEESPHQRFREEEMVMVGSKQVEVEQGLIRFVKNDRIRLLTICLPCSGRVTLWKKERRSKYGLHSQDIPLTWGGLGPAV